MKFHVIIPARFVPEELERCGQAGVKAAIRLRIRTTGGETKLFRDGDYPVLRGTIRVRCI